MSDKDVTTTSSQNQDKDKDNKIILEDLKEPLIFFKTKKPNI